MKIELGGGTRARGGLFKNYDACATADVVCDLNELPWPIADDSVTDLYSAHCLEHLQYGPEGFVPVAREIARICRLEAYIEIRVPDACGEMAMCPTHTTVISINMMLHATSVFPEIYWPPSQLKRLILVGITPGADAYWFPRARKSPLFAGWTDEEIMTWVPRTRHENRFFLTVEANR
jgi:hypothetical protein